MPRSRASALLLCAFALALGVYLWLFTAVRPHYLVEPGAWEMALATLEPVGLGGFSFAEAMGA
jgi:hypothetical protein